MKHVFLVNSHTTFLSSLGVINLLKIRDKDVVLLYARNYSNSLYDFSYKICNVDHLYYTTDEVYHTNDKKVVRDYIRKVDEIIKRDIEGSFHLYVPNFCNGLVCLLYSSLKCKRISFIQESAQSTVNAYRCDISIWKGLKRRIKFILQKVPFRTWISPCYYRNDYVWKQGKMYTYALNDAIFKNFPAQNIIITWPIVKMDFKIETKATFFICDGWVQHNMCEEDVFISLMHKLVKENIGKYNYIKFHPNQIESERKQILDFFKGNNATYEIMDQTIPFEVILSSYKNLKIVGMGSALCFFAKDMHHNVVCHDDWCYDNSELFRNHIQMTGNKLFKEIYTK